MPATPATPTRCALAALLAALLAAPGARSAMWDRDYQDRCPGPSTMDIVACLGRETQGWDARLNANYQALLRVMEPGQRDALVRAQRQWMAYRDANCAFYGAREGTIRQIAGAECLRSMTKDRALELDQAAKP